MQTVLSDCTFDKSERKKWIEQATADYTESKIGELNKVGLNRTFLDYYLLGLYAPLKSMYPVKKLGNLDSFIKEMPSNEVDFYFHFPFCKTDKGKKCTFCHFYKIHVKDKNPFEKKYLSRAKKEILFYKKLLGNIRVRSIYFGGGTPSLMSLQGLKDITSFLNEKFEIAKDAEKKFEIHSSSGQDTTLLEKKLEVLKDFGVTNIVIDIQTFNKSSLASISRGNASIKDMLLTIQKCQEHGFNHFTTALMLGLPFETVETFALTLQKILAVKSIETINTFLLMFREHDPITQQLEKHPEQFCSEKERDIMNIMARNVFLERGFREGPIFYFNKAEQIPKQQTCKFECENLLGIGPSAFGYLNSKKTAMQYFNMPNLEEYCKSIDNGKIPIWRGALMNKNEQARRKIIFGMNNCAVINKESIFREFGFDVDKELGQYVKAFESLGLINNTADSISLTKKGLMRAEEITYFFASEEVRNRQHRTLEPNDKAELIRHECLLNMPVKNEQKFEKYAKLF